MFSLSLDIRSYLQQLPFGSSPRGSEDILEAGDHWRIADHPHDVFLRTKFYMSDSKYSQCHLYLPKHVVDGRFPGGLPAGGLLLKLFPTVPRFLASQNSCSSLCPGRTGGTQSHSEGICRPHRKILASHSFLQ